MGVVFFPLGQLLFRQCRGTREATRIRFPIDGTLLAYQRDCFPVADRKRGVAKQSSNRPVRATCHAEDATRSPLPSAMHMT